MVRLPMLFAIAVAAAVPSASARAQTSPGVGSAPSMQSNGVAPAAKPAASEAHRLSTADVDAWLDGYLPYALRAGDIAGAVVVVVKDGKILTTRGYGYADVAKRTPVDPDQTLFRPGSVSKLVTWTAVMQLVEQRKLDLDTDINGYLDFSIPPFEGHPITLRQIMTHTSGFEERGKDVVFYDPKNFRPLGAFLKMWVPERIYPPGSTPAYSNWATALAGYVVERVSHVSFDDYVEQRIFTPLGMHNSTFRQPLPARFAPQLATGYPRASGPGKTFEFVGPAPAGSLSATGSDMARFMIAHLQEGELDGQRVLDPATAKMMHDSPLARVDPFSLVPPLSRMELGFFETDINGHEVIGHLGDTENFHTILHLFMNDGVGLFASFNSVGKDGAVAALRAALFQDFANRYFPSTEQDGRVAPKLAVRHARMLVGHWQGSRKSVSNFFSILTNLFGQTTISVGSAGDLAVSGITDPDGVKRRWVEVAPFVWRDVNGHDRLAAKVVDGKVVRWSWEMLSPFEVFDRVPATLSAAWILPSLVVSFGILLLSFLGWPITWLIRRHYGANLPESGRAVIAYRGTRLVAGLAIAVVAGWAATISAMIADVNNLTEASDPALWALQICGLIIFVAAVPVTGWNAWLAWRTGRSWFGRVWSVLMFLAALLFLYVAYSFGLLTMTVNY